MLKYLLQNIFAGNLPCKTQAPTHFSKPTRILFHARGRHLPILVSVAPTHCDLCRWKDHTVGIRQVTLKLLLRRKSSKITPQDQPILSQIDIIYDCKD